jgi:hypothetical protein
MVPLKITDALGRAWIVLATAELNYAEILGHRRVHAAQATRAEWTELLSGAHQQERRARNPRLQIWRASVDFDRVYLVVEPRARLRVCGLRPPHGRWALAHELPPTAPPLAPPLEQERVDPGRIVRAAPVGAAPRPVEVLPPLADERALAVLFLVDYLSERDPRAGVSEIAAHLHVDREEVRRALRILATGDRVPLVAQRPRTKGELSPEHQAHLQARQRALDVLGLRRT